MSWKQWLRAVFRRLARPAVAVGATLLTLLAGEVLVRVLGWAPAIKPIELSSYDCIYQRSTNPILGFELKTGYRCDTPDFIQTYERTNSYGQRDREHTVQKPQGVRRILLLGDSVVEGYGLSESETMSRQLEDLYPEGPTEVLNFGVSAYCTRAETELLEVKGLRFQPDVVVLVFVENDFDNFNREAFPLGGMRDRPPVVKVLFQKSHLFRLASLRLNLFHFGAEADPGRWNHDAIGDNNVAEGLRRFPELADRHGFQPLVVIWPRFLDDRIVDVCFMPHGSEQLVVEHLAAMLRDLRQDLGAPNLPIVIGELGVGGHEMTKRAENPRDREATAMVKFRQAQKAVADDPSLKNVTFVSTLDFWDTRLQELRVMADKYQRVKREQKIPDTRDNVLPTRELTQEYWRLGGHWYCHYNGSATTYSLIGYALAQALIADHRSN